MADQVALDVVLVRALEHAPAQVLLDGLDAPRRIEPPVRSGSGVGGARPGARVFLVGLFDEEGAIRQGAETVVGVLPANQAAERIVGIRHMRQAGFRSRVSGGGGSALEVRLGEQAARAIHVAGDDDLAHLITDPALDQHTEAVGHLARIDRRGGTTDRPAVVRHLDRQHTCVVVVARRG